MNHIVALLESFLNREHKFISQQYTDLGIQGPCSKTGRHPEAPDKGHLQGEVWEAATMGGERAKTGPTEKVRKSFFFFLMHTSMRVH